MLAEYYAVVGQIEPSSLSLETGKGEPGSDVEKSYLAQ
jgi:hypothetical protein